MDSIIKHGYFPEKSTIWGVGGTHGVMCDQKTRERVQKLRTTKFPKNKGCNIMSNSAFRGTKFRKISYITILLVSLCSKFCFSWLFSGRKKHVKGLEATSTFIFDLPWLHLMAMFVLVHPPPPTNPHPTPRDYGKKRGCGDDGN